MTMIALEWSGDVRSRLRRRRVLLQTPLVRMRDAWLLADPSPGRLAVRDASIDRAPPFFVLGSPRSGTTLLRQTLNRHGELFLPPENGAILAMIRAYGAGRGGRWQDVVPTVLEAFSGGYEYAHWDLAIETLLDEALALSPERRNLASLFALIYRRWGEDHAPGKSRWGDKSTPGDFAYLHKLARVFPTAAYVHIVRDGRDCVASCCRAGFFSRSPRLAALAWHDNVRFCRRFGGGLPRDRFHQMRYEDLVSEPERVLRELCGFLGIDFERRMLETPSTTDAFTSDVRAIAHHGNVMNAISTRSIGGWREALEPGVATQVSRLMRPELRGFGYEG